MVQLHGPGRDVPFPADRREPAARQEREQADGHDHDEAFSTFFRDRYRAVVRSVMYAGASLEDAEDAAAVAMTEAYLRWSFLENPPAWVRTAALRHYVNNVQRDRRRPLLEAEAARTTLGDASQPVFHAEPGERDQVVAVLRELPSAQREVMALTIDGFEPARIAELLQLSPATVRSNLRHARDRLRRGLTGLNDE